MGYATYTLTPSITEVGMEKYESVDGLGLCEHCEVIVSISQYVGDDASSADWMCRCGKTLTHLSFGFDKGTRGARKVRWVGPGGKWVDKKPTENFRLGNIQATTGPKRFF